MTTTNNTSTRARSANDNTINLTDDQFQSYLDKLDERMACDGYGFNEFETCPEPMTPPSNPGLMKVWYRSVEAEITSLRAIKPFWALDYATNAHSMLSRMLAHDSIFTKTTARDIREHLRIDIEELTYHPDLKTFGWCPGAGDRLDPTVTLEPGQGAAELCLYDDCALMESIGDSDDDEGSVTFAEDETGDVQEARENADAHLFRVVELTPEQTMELAQKLMAMCENVSEVEVRWLMSLRPLDLQAELSSDSWEATPKEVRAFVNLCWRERLVPVENRENMALVARCRDIALDNLLSRIQAAKSVQNLVKLIGECGYLSAVAIANNTGRWYTHMKARDGLSETITALPEGYRHFGLDYARYVLALNAATIRAAGIHSPDVDWSSRLGKLTYVVGNVQDEQRAKGFASKLTQWLSANIHRSLKVKAIGTYPKAPSAEGDIWEHGAMGGNFLATESVEEKVLCPYCDGQGTLPNGLTCPACDGLGEGVAIELHARVLGMSISEFQGSFKPRTSYLEWFVGPLAKCPSALVTTSDSQEIPVLPKRTIEVLRQGVVKATGYAPISLTPAPYIEGWESVNAMLASLVRI